MVAKELMVGGALDGGELGRVDGKGLCARELTSPCNPETGLMESSLLIPVYLTNDCAQLFYNFYQRQVSWIRQEAIQYHPGISG